MILNKKQNNKNPTSFSFSKTCKIYIGLLLLFRRGHEEWGGAMSYGQTVSAQFQLEGRHVQSCIENNVQKSTKKINDRERRTDKQRDAGRKAFALSQQNTQSVCLCVCLQGTAVNLTEL